MIVRIPYKKKPVLDRELVQDNFIGRDLISVIHVLKGGLGATVHGHLWKPAAASLPGDVRPVSADH